MSSQRQVEDRWLKTADAAHICGCSQWYLKQCRDCYEDGFLLEREHYILGASRTAPIKWNVNAVMDAFHERGRFVRAADQALKEARKGK